MGPNLSHTSVEPSTTLSSSVKPQKLSSYRNSLYNTQRVIKVRNIQTVKANVVIFATSNGTERLSKPLLSRFTVFEIAQYTGI